MRWILGIIVGAAGATVVGSLVFGVMSLTAGSNEWQVQVLDTGPGMAVIQVTAPGGGVSLQELTPASSTPEPTAEPTPVTDYSRTSVTGLTISETGNEEYSVTWDPFDWDGVEYYLIEYQEQGKVSDTNYLIDYVYQGDASERTFTIYEMGQWTLFVRAFSEDNQEGALVGRLDFNTSEPDLCAGRVIPDESSQGSRITLAVNSGSFAAYVPGFTQADDAPDTILPVYENGVQVGNHIITQPWFELQSDSFQEYVYESYSASIGFGCDEDRMIAQGLDEAEELIRNEAEAFAYSGYYNLRNLVISEVSVQADTYEDGSLAFHASASVSGDYDWEYFVGHPACGAVKTMIADRSDACGHGRWTFAALYPKYLVVRYEGNDFRPYVPEQGEGSCVVSGPGGSGYAPGHIGLDGNVICGLGLLDIIGHELTIGGDTVTVTNVIHQFNQDGTVVLKGTS